MPRRLWGLKPHAGIPIIATLQNDYLGDKILKVTLWELWRLGLYSG